MKQPGIFMSDLVIGGLIALAFFVSMAIEQSSYTPDNWSGQMPEKREPLDIDCGG